MKGNVIWEGNILQIIVGPGFLALGSEKSSREQQNIEGYFYNIVI